MFFQKRKYTEYEHPPTRTTPTDTTTTLRPTIPPLPRNNLLVEFTSLNLRSIRRPSCGRACGRSPHPSLPPLLLPRSPHSKLWHVAQKSAPWEPRDPTSRRQCSAHLLYFALPNLFPIICVFTSKATCTHPILSASALRVKGTRKESKKNVPKESLKSRCLYKFAKLILSP